MTKLNLKVKSSTRVCLAYLRASDCVYSHYPFWKRRFTVSRSLLNTYSFLCCNVCFLKLVFSETVVPFQLKSLIFVVHYVRRWRIIQGSGEAGSDVPQTRHPCTTTIYNRNWKPLLTSFKGHKASQHQSKYRCGQSYKFGGTV